MSLHVVAAGWLTGVGPSGAERRLLGLLRAAVPQLRDGERITLLSRAGGPTIDGIETHRIDLPATPTWRRAFAERRLLPAVLRELEATLLDQSFAPVAPGLPCPVVLTLHDLRDLGPFRRRPRWLARPLLARSIRRAAHVVVPSRYTADMLRAAFGDAPQCTIVPGGVDGASADCAVTARTSPFFLHVGHLEARKNLALLLDAFAPLAKRTPARLVLVGRDAGAAAALRRQARRLHIAERVTFAGPVDDAELATLYAGATAVVVPSLEEGFGLPALEALAAGRPTLVSDAGALPEVVGDAGCVLPGRDIEAWRRALSEQLAGIDGAAGIVARRSRADSFTWRDAAARLLAVWRHVATLRPTSIRRPDDR